jgi:hypothetical protein
MLQVLHCRPQREGADHSARSRKGMRRFLAPRDTRRLTGKPCMYRRQCSLHGHTRAHAGIAQQDLILLEYLGLQYPALSFDWHAGWRSLAGEQPPQRLGTTRLQ